MKFHEETKEQKIVRSKTQWVRRESRQTSILQLLFLRNKLPRRHAA